MPYCSADWLGVTHVGFRVEKEKEARGGHGSLDPPSFLSYLVHHILSIQILMKTEAVTLQFLIDKKL